MPRSYGHVPDPEGHMVTGSHVLLGSVSTLPAKASLRDHVNIFDQVKTSSCVGWATAQGIWVSLQAAGLVFATFPSAHGIYTIARCIDRIDNRRPLRDIGSMPNRAMRGLTEWGVPMSLDWPFDPDHINREPVWDELKKSSRLKLLGYYRVDGTGPSVVERIKQAITSGYAVPLATQVDASFEDYNGSGVLSAPTSTLGGHYICAVGYETMQKGNTVFTIANSWGDWGDKGFGYCDESWLLRTTDRYVMNLHRKVS